MSADLVQQSTQLGKCVLRPGQPFATFGKSKTGDFLNLLNNNNKDNKIIFSHYYIFSCVYLILLPHKVFHAQNVSMFYWKNNKVQPSNLSTHANSNIVKLCAL